MRSLLLTMLCLLLAGLPAAAAEKQALVTKKDRLSYAAGYDMAIKIKESGVDLDYDIVLKAARDVLKGRKILMSRQEVGNVIMAYRLEKKNELAEKNRREGEAFLADHKKQKGVVTLPSGLQYRILRAGTGKSPGPDDIVTVNYRGTLVDGGEFDNSYKRGKPITFPVNQVIKGWSEALQLMKTGAKWQLVIPPDLGYGNRGVPDTPIGPDAVLIFEVELLSVSPGSHGSRPPSAPEMK